MYLQYLKCITNYLYIQALLHVQANIRHPQGEYGVGEEKKKKKLEEATAYSTYKQQQLQN